MNKIEARVIAVKEFKCRGVTRNKQFEEGTFAFTQEEAPTAIMTIYENGEKNISCLVGTCSNRGGFKCNYKLTDDGREFDKLETCPYSLDRE